MIFIDCPVHGQQAIDHLVGGTGTVNISDVKTMCPVSGCGRIVRAIDGTYDLTNSILTSFRAASREDLEAFRNIATAVKSGDIGKEQADAEVAGLGQGLRQIWEWANANPAFFGILTTIIAIWLACCQTESSDRSAVEQHLDAQAQLSASQSGQQEIVNETRVLLSQQEALQKIVEVLQRHHVGDVQPEPQKPSRTLQPQPDLPRTPSLAGSSGNRHERRKAACLNRRGKKR